MDAIYRVFAIELAVTIPASELVADTRYFTRANSAETPTVLKIWLGVSVCLSLKPLKL